MIKKLLLISVVVGCLSVFLCTPAFAFQTETWTYNGLELPALPDWDKTAYPYAAFGDKDYGYVSFSEISSDLADYGDFSFGFSFWVSSVPFEFYAGPINITSYHEVVQAPGPCTVMRVSYNEFLCDEETLVSALVSLGYSETDAVSFAKEYLAMSGTWYFDDPITLEDGSFLSCFEIVPHSEETEATVLVWSSHDVYAVSDGSVYFAGSSPVTDTEDPPSEGSGALEAITVFFSADWLSYDSGIVSVGLEDLDPTKTYVATVYLYEKGGSASDPLRTSTLTDITGETYNNALVFTGLDVNTEYETSIVVSCGEDTVGEATASFKTPDYDYAINVLSTNVQYNTFSCEIEVTGLPEYEIDNPDCWVYVSATLNDGTSEPDEWLNSNTNLNGNKARIYFSQTQLDPETEYTLTLEIFRTADDWTKGESTGVTETVTFTTKAAYVADEEEDSEDTSTKDEAAEKFEEWDTVTDIPEDVTDKTNEGDKLLNDMDTLEKPEPDELVPDLSVDLVPVNGFFDAIFGYGLIVEMMTMAAGFALVATVLFGKRG